VGTVSIDGLCIFVERAAVSGLTEAIDKGLRQILLCAKSPDMPPHPLPGDGKPVRPFAAKGANPPAACYV
jgi:hypothetical protein